jgi:hypothetical protein
MEESILKSTKKVLGIGLDDDSFDLDVITHINSALSNLSQLGVGPEEGVFIEDDTTDWDALGIESVPILSQTKTLIYLRVRVLFDPPQTSFLQDALAKQILEHEWRIDTMREATEWVDPDPPEEVVLDG